MNVTPATQARAKAPTVERAKKLPKLPPNTRVQKRPLLRPAIPSPYAGASSEKVVYISSRTPFMSAVKRVQKLLSLADKRAVQSQTNLYRNNSRKRKRGSRDAGTTREDCDGIDEIAALVEQRRRDGEKVVLKATGKAIEKALGIGLWFQSKEEYRVRITTGSVGAIDDIVEVDLPTPNNVDESPQQDMEKGRETQLGTLEREDNDATPNVPAHQDVSDSGSAATKADRVAEEIPETRVRYTSMVEIAVSLR
ncbi:hypothetical protein LTR66_012096 [Elasticomyces elasticus]|nr:hypothetical protein LTR66_012096 [Elasticomyces elasticus]